MRLTVVVHSAMFVEGSQVEAFPEAVVVPYLNSNNHKQQQSVKMLEHWSYREYCRLFFSPQGAGGHLFPWQQPSGLEWERVHSVTWGAEEEQFNSLLYLWPQPASLTGHLYSNHTHVHSDVTLYITAVKLLFNGKLTSRFFLSNVFWHNYVTMFLNYSWSEKMNGETLWYYLRCFGHQWHIYDQMLIYLTLSDLIFRLQQHGFSASICIQSCNKSDFSVNKCQKHDLSEISEDFRVPIYKTWEFCWMWGSFRRTTNCAKTQECTNLPTFS